LPNAEAESSIASRPFEEESDSPPQDENQAKEEAASANPSAIPAIISDTNNESEEKDVPKATQSHDEQLYTEICQIEPQAVPGKQDSNNNEEKAPVVNEMDSRQKAQALLAGLESKEVAKTTPVKGAWGWLNEAAAIAQEVVSTSPDDKNAGTPKKWTGWRNVVGGGSPDKAKDESVATTPKSHETAVQDKDTESMVSESRIYRSSSGDEVPDDESDIIQQTSTESEKPMDEAASDSAKRTAPRNKPTGWWGKLK
jgi:hypothetical protein